MVSTAFHWKSALTMTVALGSFSQVLLSMKDACIELVENQCSASLPAVRHGGEPEAEPLLTDKFHQRQKSWVMSPSDFQ